MSNKTKSKVFKTTNSIFTITAMLIYIAMPLLTLAPQVANAVAVPTNPPIGQSCGLDIALVIDSSGSINNTELGQMKTAFNSFVSVFLPETPTQFSVTEFDNTATIRQAFTTSESLINTAINSAVSGGATNWQDGLLKAKSTFDPRPSVPNLVIFASDGEPNKYYSNVSNPLNPTGLTGPGNGFSQAALDAAITQADIIKNAGTRIITLGIGVSGSNADHLKAISSEDAYYNTTDFGTLAITLQQLAIELCGGHLTVTKRIGTPDSWTPAAAGWTFDITPGHNGQTTDGNGQTAAVDLINGTYNVTEVGMVSGYSFGSASCTSAANNGTTSQNGVSGIQITTDNIVSCVFYNSFLPPTCTDADLDTYCSDVDCDDSNPNIYPGATEMCNGVDDNCNQVIDEGFNVGDSCSAGLGICQASGQFVCTIDGLGTECNAVAGTPSEEICEAGQLDEDCDGLNNEGCVCVDGTTQQCGQTDVGLCEYGLQTCSGGVWGSSCVGAIDSTIEICGNGEDEDCNGSDLQCSYLTINAHKVVCQSEADLPNWGNGGPDITSITATDYVAQNPNCQLTSGWNFEWAYADTLNPGDNIIGPAGPGWTTFGPTDSNGLATTEIGTLDGNRLWLREVIQGGYFPFSGDTSAPRDDVSAEIYCHTDVLNYDNYDRIDNPSLDNPNPYYCVAFNAPTAELEPTGTVTACKYDDKNEDGVYQPFNGETGDTPLAWNITVWYYSDPAGPGEIIHSTTTDPVSGCVTFNDLSYGTYTVHEEHISDWVQTLPYPDGSPTIIISETNVNPTVIFLNYYQESEEEPVCGNEVVETGEQCDDGNTSNGDGCSANCTIEQCISGTTTPCSTGNLGICLAGIQTCGQSGFWGECVQNVQSSSEICGNGVDEDCNGSDDTCHSRGGQFMPPAEPEGRVLGEATTTEGIACGIYLLRYIKYGADNDPAEVRKLQIFLNEFMGDNLTVNGIYDQETLNAVNQFQLAYKEEVLRPWVLAEYLENENTPTGYVYLTTKRWINLLKCPSLNIPMPNLVPDLTGSSLGLVENNEEVLGEETVIEEEPTTTVEEQPEEVSAPLEEAVSEETVIPTTTEKEGSNWLTIIILIIISAVILGLAAWAYKKK